LDFLYKNYEYEHTQSEHNTCLTLLKVCRNNGGCLYHSEVYARLSDTETKIYTYPWTEIYKLLIDEINNKRKI
jgi:hypothetical protein